MSSPISVLSQQAQTYPGILLFDITSAEDGTVLHLSQLPYSSGGISYTAQVLGVSGFEQRLEDSPLGIMAIPDISIILGDANGSMTTWDNAHYFKGAKITVTFVFYNEQTKGAASSDSRVIFKGICNAPDQVTATQMTISAYSRFNAEYLLLPTSRISQFSQTSFPGDGAQDTDLGGSSLDANENSIGFQYTHGATQVDPVTGFKVPIGGAADAFRSYVSCGYGPARTPSLNPLGNYMVQPATVDPTQTTSTIIASAGAMYVTTDANGNTLTNGALQGHVVFIISGKGAGQIRRIASNTGTQITVANPFTTIPDGTSSFGVLFGTCGKTTEECQLRGMYSTDSSGRTTSRFQGITYVPLQNFTQVTSHLIANPDVGKFNQPIPVLYGTGQSTLIELFSLTSHFNNDYVRGQYLLCGGPVVGLSNLVVGATSVPQVAQSTYSTNPSSIPPSGQWTFQNGDLGVCYVDPGFPTADPKSGMCVVFAKFPPQFLQNVSSAGITVQWTGIPVWVSDVNGNLTYTAVVQNPAWIIMDVLARSGWKFSELNLQSFYAFSVYANQLIDLNISPSQQVLNPRFQFSLIIQQQAPASEILRNLLSACHAILSYDSNGLLRLDQENRIAASVTTSPFSSGLQWVEPTDGSGISIGTQLQVGIAGTNLETVTVLNVQLDNTGEFFQFQANFTQNHGSPEPVIAPYAYGFGLSSILQNYDGTPDLTRSSLKTAETPNEFVAGFQDSLRAFVNDSVNLVSTIEANNFGAPVIGNLNATGFTTVDAAVRIAQLALFKSHGRRNSNNSIGSRGNLFATLTTSVKGFGVGIGSLVTITYPKEGWSSKSFRVVQISPTQDQQFAYWKMKFTLREHDDAWYDIINGVIQPQITYSPVFKVTQPTPPHRIRIASPIPPLFN